MACSERTKRRKISAKVEEHLRLIEKKAMDDFLALNSPKEYPVDSPTATYKIARRYLVEYEQNTDVNTESDSPENMGKGRRRKKQAVIYSEDEDDDCRSDSPIMPTPPPTLRSPSPSILGRPQSLPTPQPTLGLSPLPIVRPSRMPQPSPSTMESSTTATPGPTNTSPLPTSTLRSSDSRPLGNHRLPSLSTRRSVPMSPGNPLVEIRDSKYICILKLLEELKETQKIHGRMLQTLLQQRDSIGTTISSTPEGFPLKTIHDLEMVEDKLANPNFMSELTVSVADIGGATVDEATRRMMSFLLDHGLSRQYNFVGRNGKREFKALKLFEVIYGGLKKNAMTSQITRKDAEKAVSKWLIGSRDRGGNRQARQTAPQHLTQRNT